jgi:ELWxxDGT repeat protein
MTGALTIRVTCAPSAEERVAAVDRHGRPRYTRSVRPVLLALAVAVSVAVPLAARAEWQASHVTDFMSGPLMTIFSDALANGSFIFQMGDGVHGVEPWVTDGTPAGTRLLADINPSGDSLALPVAIVNGTVVLIANDGTHDYELWRSDGTTAGTSLLTFRARRATSSSASPTAATASSAAASSATTATS